MIEARTLREAQEAAKQQSELEKKALQRQMADRFEADVKSVVGAVARATKDMQRVATEITASVSGTSAQATAAAAASEEASASINTVASATEELASSVAEISRQVTHSATSPAARWRRPGRPPRWSVALPPRVKKSAMCFA